MKDPIAEEGERAAALKESERFTIVIGNPPYDREQRATSDTAKRKGGVVRHGAPGIHPLIQKIVDISKSAQLGGFRMANLYNDYIYFWRWAVWQATEMPTGPGVVAFITASSYLDGVSMGGVRSYFRKTFDELWIIDLGGNNRGAHPEDNIFDILTPVSIAIGISKGRKDANSQCLTRYLRTSGSRSDKLTHLAKIGLYNVSDEISGEGMDCLTPRSISDYYSWPKISSIFPWIHPGCKAGRTWPIADTKSVLNRRWRALLSQIPNRRVDLFKESKEGRTISSNPQPLLNPGGSRLPSLGSLNIGDSYEGIEQYGYRSFDRQYIIADSRLINSPRPDLWNVHGAYQVFLTTLTSTKLGHGPVVTATPYIPDLDHFSGRGAKNIIPLYRGEAEYNINIDLLQAWGQLLGATISTEGIMSYIYALGGTAAFSERFASEITEQVGPFHLPMTTSYILFQQAVILGRDLLWWHTWGERFIQPQETQHIKGVAQVVDPVDAMPIDKHSYNYNPNTDHLQIGTGCIGPVSPEAWNFEVSGLKVLQFWLGYRMKNRKGRKSSPLDDIRPDHWTHTDELLRLLAILEHTIEVTPKAAELLEEIVSSPLILAKDLPQPTEDQCRPPKLILG